MPTRITQVDDEANARTILRVDGEMFIDDAKLVGRLAEEISGEKHSAVIVDLADLDLLDSDAASELLRLRAAGRIEVAGIDEFVQTAIDRAEGRGIHTT
jgi:anti-anti-sigma regulatory factor